ncbi:MAG: hypothetical protein E6241_10700, partial [Clostridium sp.]|nr:hypothetical protein [Clostridium sp.]
IMNNINEEFTKIELDKTKQKKLKNKLLAIGNEINKTEKTFEELKIKLSKEKKDVDKLDK